MVGWYRIIYNTNGSWAQNKNIIVNGIKPVVDSLERTSNLVNFFFFQYNEADNQGVKFTFYGDKEKVKDEFNLHLHRQPDDIETWRPKKTEWRFEEEYPLGVKLLEIGSRLALCSIDNKKPISIANGTRPPITTVLRHVYLQNLGYGKVEERIMAPFVDLPLLGLYNFLNIRIK